MMVVPVEVYKLYTNNRPVSKECRMNNNRKLLKDIAYEKIREKVLQADDQYTSENQLVEELNMSRTPIREALQRLQYEGYIHVLPNQGIAIPDVSVREANDIVDYRIALEIASLRKAVDLFDDNDFETLKQLINQQRIAVGNNDVIKYLITDVEFHLYLLRVVGNELFIQGIERVCGRLYRLRRRMRSNPKKIYDRIDEHLVIIEHLRNKNIDSAVETMRAHLETGRSHIF